MKKLIPLLAIVALLSGCETTQSGHSPAPSDVKWYTVDSKWVMESNSDKNSNQENIQESLSSYQVFQVIPKGSLALKCEFGPEMPCTGLVVLIPKKIVKKPYDGLKVTLRNPQVVDTYSYTTKSDDRKTVPILSGTLQ